MIGEDLGIQLPPETEVVLYRIAHEAITNCAKYANASVVTLAFGGDVDRVTFMISDNGVGFDLMKLTDGENASGLGLLSMRERVEAVGGRLTLESVPGLGTRITIEISNLALDYSGVINAPSDSEQLSLL